MMNSKEIKARILQLAESDPDGFGLLAERLGAEEWSRCASHAAGFLGTWFYDQLDARYTEDECISAALMARERNEQMSVMLKEVKARRKT